MLLELLGNMDFEFLGICSLLILCAIVSYSDIKSGIIKNNLLIKLGSIPIFLNVINIIDKFDREDLMYMFLMICMIFLSLVLFFSKIWAGGDCKFFIIIILSIPVEYTNYNNGLFNSYVLILFYSFVIAYVYMFFESIKEYVLKGKNIDKCKIIENSLYQIKMYIKVYLMVMCINNIVAIILDLGNFGQYKYIINVIFNLIIILWIINKKILTNKILILIVVLIDILLVIFADTGFVTKKTLLTFCAVAIVALTKHFINAFNYKRINQNEIKEGMILSTNTSIAISQISNNLFRCLSDETLSSRLNSKEVMEIKKIKNLDQKVEIFIVKKIPMAFFISIATFLTIGSIALCY